MKVKPLIKYRLSNKAHRYIVCDPLLRTWMQPIVFVPMTAGTPWYSVWNAGPVRRFESLQMALAFSVAMVDLDIKSRAPASAE